MEYSRQSHAVYHTRYHLVFATKYRRKVFAKPGMAAYMIVIMKTVHRRHPEIEVLEVNTDKDHIHLLASIAPKIAISDAVRILKSNTARMMAKKFPFIKQVYNGEMSLWSIGYFVSTVGVNEKTIQAYIKHQGQEDSGQAKLEL
jgi:REP-associated tyrosine transposase